MANGMLGYADLAGDARAAGGMLGKGLVNLAGFESKEDAIKRIYEDTDWEDEEQTNKALAEIRRIDPNVWALAQKQRLEVENSEMDLLAKKNTRILDKYWTSSGRLEAIKNFAITNLGISQAEANTIKSTSGINKYLTKSAGGDKGLRRILVQDLKGYIDTHHKSYITQNKYRDFSQEQPTFKMPSSSIEDKEPLIDPSQTTSTYLEGQNPSSSQFGLQWDKNIRTSEIDKIGSDLQPGAAFSFDTDSATRMPGVDATVGNLADAANTVANAITSTFSDISNYFTGSVEGDKLRARQNEASSWFLNEGHSWFASNPEELDALLKISNPTQQAKAALDLYEKKIKKVK